MKVRTTDTRVTSSMATGVRSAFVAAALLSVLLMVGCESQGQTGALMGAGIGALAGQAIGGDTAGTLIGAAVGGGVGYMIGNEKDKKHAQELSQDSYPGHGEVGPLAATRWLVTSINPRNAAGDYTSKVVAFSHDGYVTTTTTKSDGKVEVSTETYRVVGTTLIINKPGYLINARYAITGNQLTISTEDFSAVLRAI